MVPPAVLALLAWQVLAELDPMLVGAHQSARTLSNAGNLLLPDPMILQRQRILLLTLHCTANLAAALARNPSSAYQHRGVWYVKPRDKVWWDWFADDCISDEGGVEAALSHHQAAQTGHCPGCL